MEASSPFPEGQEEVYVQDQISYFVNDVPVPRWGWKVSVSSLPTPILRYPDVSVVSICMCWFAFIVPELEAFR